MLDFSDVESGPRFQARQLKLDCFHLGRWCMTCRFLSMFIKVMRNKLSGTVRESAPLRDLGLWFIYVKVVSTTLCSISTIICKRDILVAVAMSTSVTVKHVVDMGGGFHLLMRSRTHSPARVDFVDARSSGNVLVVFNVGKLII